MKVAKRLGVVLRAWMVVVASTGPLCTSVNAQPAGAVRAVGPVTEIWTHDDRFSAFHKELAARYADTPPLDTFMSEEQWVTVLASSSLVMPVFVKARVPKGVKLTVGDVVEIAVKDNLEAKSYLATSEVSRTICQKDATHFSECSNATEVGMWSADGAKLSFKRKP